MFGFLLLLVFGAILRPPANNFFDNRQVIENVVGDKLPKLLSKFGHSAGLKSGIKSEFFIILIQKKVYGNWVC